MKEKFKDFGFRSHSLTLIETVNSIIAEYMSDSYMLTLRQLYYQLVTREVIPNHQREYNRIGRLLNDARLAGLVDWDAIEDRTRNLQSLPHWDNPESVVQAVAEQYRIDKWALGQTHYVEVWVEKDALVGVLERACNSLGVPFFACRGYTSASELYGASKRMLDALDAGLQPYVIHLGDHDPSGKDMTRDIVDRLRMFTGTAIPVDRIALNFDQVEEYDLPPNPAKSTDSRFEAYRAEFGEESWEIDALNPRIITGLIERAVLAVRDEDAWARAVEREGSERRELCATADHWPAVVELITEISQ